MIENNREMAIETLRSQWPYPINKNVVGQRWFYNNQNKDLLDMTTGN
jgi:hypothetical protein